MVGMKRNDSVNALGMHKVESNGKLTTGIDR